MKPHSKSQWEHRKIWMSFDIKNGATPSSGVSRFWDGEIPWVGPADLGRLNSREIFTGARNLTSAGYKSCGVALVPKGTIILSSRAPIGHVAIAGRELCFNQGCKGLQLKDDLDQSFSYWLILSLKNKLVASGRGTTFMELSSSELRNIDFIQPPLSTQKNIGIFLDEKCAKIDEAIRIKEEQIKLLHERRQILIQQAVTRGLNPDVPMKDSGIDWIGQIPAHWEVIRLRYLTTKVGSGLTPSGGALAYTDEGIPLLRSQNIHFGSIDIKSAARISPQVHDSMKNSQVVFGDVLLNITGGSIGRCHYVTTKEPLNVNQHVCIIRPSDKISPFYLNTLLSSEVGQLQIWLQQQGGGREGINFAAIKEFVFPVPSLQEQSEIEQLVSNLTKKTRASTHIKNQQITALKEYKTTLINAAVTGKIRITPDMLPTTTE